MNTFKQLGISDTMADTLSALGYETPTPVQAKTIPLLLDGMDVLAQAQTGTGKTAAFALPILANLDTDIDETQALILAPTRELAIQVAEAFTSYGKGMKRLQILPIYGGQDYKTQLKRLKRGAHIVVGTPGRVMDHIDRGTLKFGSLKTLVLDEADEMLNMGFIEDVQWILSKIPHEHQTALFSATMPKAIRKIVDDYLTKPAHIKIESKTKSMATIDQHYILASNRQKLDILTRILEVDDYDGVMVFTRTKTLSSELAERLQARGLRAAAINGDMNQASRENVIKRIKSKALDIVVATEVAARGLDVDRISHVINYDIPHDAQSYTHRIGRTGRAGRSGKAILFVTPKERYMLRDIERSTQQDIKEMVPPSNAQIKEKRFAAIATKVDETLQRSKLDDFRNLITQISHDCEYSDLDIAAAFAKLAMGKLSPEPEVIKDDESGKGGYRPYDRGDRNDRGRRRRSGGGDFKGGRGRRRDGGSEFKGRGRRSDEDGGGRSRRSSFQDDGGYKKSRGQGSKGKKRRGN